MQTKSMPLQIHNTCFFPFPQVLTAQFFFFLIPPQLAIFFLDTALISLAVRVGKRSDKKKTHTILFSAGNGETPDMTEAEHI